MKKIICFMGLDGSGKSTCIEYAYNEMKKCGQKVKIVRAAYVAVTTRGLIRIGKKILMKENSDPYGNYAEYLSSIRERANKTLVYRIFSFLTTCEFGMQIFTRIVLNRLFGYTLLVDRYIYDNAVTYAANLGKGEEYIRKTIEKKWRYAPKADMIIYVKTPAETCFSRKSDIPDILYLRIREPLYEKVCEMYDGVVIYGDRPKQQMLDDTMEKINRLGK